MRDLQVEQRIFGTESDADYEGGADIVHNPVGSGHRFRRPIGEAPQKFPGLAFDLRWVELKDLPIVSVDKQEAAPYLQQ